ncbi:hypothetical protein HUJ04_006250 [Dendroctonus ponderosae]|uniref:L-Fucosyltransferase n=2 Tax=Dendroctonus ponderosae TaxID=77166 RepID=A0AAR5PSP8_DENPD|nr:hypothetical protein HUJ04_006250 [Dendroctonus ponderosae]KAH1005225.1 hypothetical protein HUJ04_006250 [Dendroctonus ponderosae]
MNARRPAIIITFGSLMLTIWYVNFPPNLQRQCEDCGTETASPIPSNAVEPNQYTFKDLDKLLCSREVEPSNETMRPCPKHGIATMIPGGRTAIVGNQMWEYSAIWFVAKETGRQPYIPTCVKLALEGIFEGMSLPSLQAIGHCPFDQSSSVDSMEQLVLPHQSIIVPAFSFERRLAIPHLDEVVREFKFKKPLRDKAQEDLREIAADLLPSATPTFIGVHVRRGDYGAFLKRKWNATMVTATFFRKSMNYYRAKFSNCLFIYISDDPLWCFQHFGNLSDVFVTSLNSRRTPAEDLALMAACNHTIFDYGTFGEWGSILAGGLAIFNNRDQNINPHLPNWIIME